MRRKIDLVDDKEIGTRDSGATFRRNLVAGGNVDDVDGEVGEFGREGRGEIVSPGFDKHEVEIRELRAHLSHGREIEGGAFCDAVFNPCHRVSPFRRQT
jgi:hypothetical protein